MSEQAAAVSDAPARRANWLELFFDLVFVTAVAALAQQLHDDHSVVGLAVFAGLFVPVWWVWRGFAWYASGFGTGDRMTQAALCLGMVGVAALASGVDGAAHGDSDVFVASYASLLVILAALYARGALRQRGARRLAAMQVAGYGIGATLWLASLGLDEDLRPVVWTAAMLLLIAVPVALLRQPAHAFRAEHIADRYGLFTIIVLGDRSS